MTGETFKIGDIIRRKSDGFEFEILEKGQVKCICRDIHHRLTWQFEIDEIDKQFEKVFTGLGR